MKYYIPHVIHIKIILKNQLLNLLSIRGHFLNEFHFYQVIRHKRGHNLDGRDSHY